MSYEYIETKGRALARLIWETERRRGELTRPGASLGLKRDRLYRTEVRGRDVVLVRGSTMRDGQWRERTDLLAVRQLDDKAAHAALHAAGVLDPRVNATILAGDCCFGGLNGAYAAEVIGGDASDLPLLRSILRSLDLTPAAVALGLRDGHPVLPPPTNPWIGVLTA